MLSSIYVENYKNLRKLRIDNLGRINLISGKNNTGKSSLLEAIYIYANEGRINSIIEVLKDRGEFLKKDKSEISILDQNLRTLSSLFSDRKIHLEDKNIINIGDCKKVSLLQLSLMRRNPLNLDNNVLLDSETITTLNISFIDKTLSKKVQIVYRLDDVKINYSHPLIDNNQFIHTNNILRDENSKLFDAIALTNKEKSVIEALKIIEPRTERIAFVEGRGRSDRSAVIKLADSDEIIPLSSMGDGINRILTIILALINSSGGYLLIDEFENGLHYSVQEQLWKIIFKLSVELDIQVFATTHSNDCISSFNQILSEQTDTTLGKYIRLDNVNGEIKEVIFSSKELDIAEQQDIELR